MARDEIINILKVKKGFAYISIYQVGINCDESYNRNKMGLNYNLRKGADFQGYKFAEKEKTRSLNNVIEKYTGKDVWKAVALILYLDIKEEEFDALKDFIERNINDFLIKSNSYSTYMRKLVCFYDWKKYGWE